MLNNSHESVSDLVSHSPLVKLCNGFRLCKGVYSPMGSAHCLNSEFAPRVVISELESLRRPPETTDLQ